MIGTRIAESRAPAIASRPCCVLCRADSKRPPVEMLPLRRPVFTSPPAHPFRAGGTRQPGEATMPLASGFGAAGRSRLRAASGDPRCNGAKVRGARQAWTGHARQPQGAESSRVAAESGTFFRMRADIADSGRAVTISLCNTNPRSAGRPSPVSAARLVKECADHSWIVPFTHAYTWYLQHLFQELPW